MQLCILQSVKARGSLRSQSEILIEHELMELGMLTGTNDADFDPERGPRQPRKE